MPLCAVQSPGRQFLIDVPGEVPRKRIVLVRHAATVSSEETRLHRTTDEPCSSLGEVQAVKVAEFLMDACIENLFVSPAERAVYTAAAIAKCQSLVGDRAPRLQIVEELRNIEVGSYSGRLASEVCRLCRPRPRCAGGCIPVATAASLTQADSGSLKGHGETWLYGVQMACWRCSAHAALPWPAALLLSCLAPPQVMQPGGPACYLRCDHCRPGDAGPEVQHRTSGSQAV